MRNKKSLSHFIALNRKRYVFKISEISRSVIDIFIDVVCPVRPSNCRKVILRVSRFLVIHKNPSPDVLLLLAPIAD